MACRLMRHYGVGYRELLDLPFRVFWLMTRYVDATRAEEDLRALRIAQAPNLNADGLKELVVGLQDQMGQAVTQKDSLDREGLEELRTLQF